jgi:hypothetical protein
VGRWVVVRPREDCWRVSVVLFGNRFDAFAVGDDEDRGER